MDLVKQVCTRSLSVCIHQSYDADQQHVVQQVSLPAKSWIIYAWEQWRLVCDTNGPAKVALLELPANCQRDWFKWKLLPGSKDK